MRWTLFSIVFWFLFAITSLAIYSVAMLVHLCTFLFDRDHRVLHQVLCFWSSFYFIANPLWRVRITGKENAKKGKPYVMCSNHQSFGDILILGGTYFSFKWVSKQSVFKVPLIGWAGKVCEYIPIVRGDKSSAEQMAADCKRWLARGISVMIFPEGTRSTDGAIGPFKMGAFRVAREAGVEVLPIVLDGTGNVLPKHGWVLRDKVNAKVHILPPMDVTSHSTVEEAAEAVRSVMLAELEKMRAPN